MSSDCHLTFLRRVFILSMVTFDGNYKVHPSASSNLMTSMTLYAFIFLFYGAKVIKRIPFSKLFAQKVFILILFIISRKRVDIGINSIFVSTPAAFGAQPYGLWRTTVWHLARYHLPLGARWCGLRCHPE